MHSYTENVAGDCKLSMDSMYSTHFMHSYTENVAGDCTVSIDSMYSTRFMQKM